MVSLNSSWTPLIKRRFLIVWIIWAAFFLTPFIVLMIQQNVSTPSEQPFLNNSYFRSAIISASVIIAIIPPFLKKFLLDYFISNTKEPDPVIIVQAYLKAEFISTALPEGISYLALVAFFMGLDKESFLILLALSAGGMLLVKPSLQELIEKIPPTFLQEQDY